MKLDEKLFNEDIIGNSKLNPITKLEDIDLPFLVKNMNRKNRYFTQIYLFDDYVYRIQFARNFSAAHDFLYRASIFKNHAKSGACLNSQYEYSDYQDKFYEELREKIIEFTGCDALKTIIPETLPKDEEKPKRAYHKKDKSDTGNISNTNSTSFNVPNYKHIYYKLDKLQREWPRLTIEINREDGTSSIYIFDTYKDGYEESKTAVRLSQLELSKLIQNELEEGNSCEIEKG